MKILHVIPAVATRYGGPSVAISGLCNALSREGVQTEVVTTDADGPARLDVPLGVPVDRDGVRTTFFHSWGPDALKPSPGLSDWLSRKAGEWDLVHVHSVFGLPCLAAGRAARRAGVPYVVRPLGHLAPWSLSQHRLRKKAFWALGGRSLVEKADALHFTSRAEMEGARLLGPGLKGFVVPLGLDLPAAGAGDAAGGFRDSVPGLGERPFVLFLGRLHKKKGLEELVDGFAATAEAGRWALVLAGEGEPGYVKSLQERAASRLPGRAFWVGWLEGDRKAAAMRETRLFALVSRQENFGISAFEAMAAGTPVLAGSGVDLASEIEEAGAGWKVEPDAGAVSAILARVLADEDELSRRGSAALRLVRERYSWPAVARALIAEFARLIGAARSGATSGARGVAVVH